MFTGYRILPTSAMRNKSPEHYNKVIFDNANAAYVFEGLINSIPKQHPNAANCITRLKARQQSFVFFLMVRLMKSDIPLQRIPEMLAGFEKIDAYPLNKFVGDDYHGATYSFLTYIFNHKPPDQSVYKDVQNFLYIRKMNILISSAGRRVSLVKAFQKELKKEYPQAKVYASDANPELSGACQIADGYFKVPLVGRPEYADELIRQCMSRDIRLIVHDH